MEKLKSKDFKDLEIQKLIEELHRLVQINFQNIATEIVKKEKIYTLSSLKVESVSYWQHQNYPYLKIYPIETFF